jgi:phosphoserine phosphatase
LNDRDRQELVALWERVDRALRAALSGVEIEEQTEAQVVEFLDVNELGLAFETLVGALADADAEVSEAVMRELVIAAGEMDLEDDADWQRLTS